MFRLLRQSAKSSCYFPGFGPAGPLLVIPDEFEDPDSIEPG